MPSEISGFSSFSSVFDTTNHSIGQSILNLKIALISGWSKQGNALWALLVVNKV